MCHANWSDDQITIPKERHIKLIGRELKKLNAAIHERDNNCCVVCGRWVEPDNKFHHEPCGIRKSDELGKGVLLCEACHFKRHFTGDSSRIKKAVEAYLKRATAAG